MLRIRSTAAVFLSFLFGSNLKLTKKDAKIKKIIQEKKMFPWTSSLPTKAMYPKPKVYKKHSLASFLTACPMVSLVIRSPLWPVIKPALYDTSRFPAVSGGWARTRPCASSYSSAPGPWNFNGSIFTFAPKHNQWGIWVTAFHGSLQVTIKIVFAIYAQLQHLWRHFIPLKNDKVLSWFSAIRYTHTDQK